MDMSSFTIANTLALRNNYNSYRNLAVKNNRQDASTEELNHADSLALRRAVKALKDFHYEDATKDATEMTIRAFVDTHNYTLEASKNSSNRDIASDYKKLKSLTQKYSSELEKIGIRSDENGYLKMSSSAINNIKGSTFEKYLGKDSEFAKQVDAIAKRLNRHVDTYI